MSKQHADNNLEGYPGEIAMLGKFRGGAICLNMFIDSPGGDNCTPPPFKLPQWTEEFWLGPKDPKAVRFTVVLITTHLRKDPGALPLAC